MSYYISVFFFFTLPNFFQLFFAGTESTTTATADPAVNAQYEVDPIELKRRTDFLKAQRDKLLAMKRAERDKQLAEAEKVESTSRPKSARAARSAFSGSKIDSETLKARKALAAKLKQEVVGN